MPLTLMQVALSLAQDLVIKPLTLPAHHCSLWNLPSINLSTRNEMQPSINHDIATKWQTNNSNCQESSQNQSEFFQEYLKHLTACVTSPVFAKGYPTSGIYAASCLRQRWGFLELSSVWACLEGHTDVCKVVRKGWSMLIVSSKSQNSRPVADRVENSPSGST